VVDVDWHGERVLITLAKRSEMPIAISTSSEVLGG
jgi:hypothetical protein